MFSRKAYLNSRGGPSVLNLSHDVKRCLTESGANSGLVNVISTQGTTAVILVENDPEIHQEYLAFISNKFESADKTKKTRRSRTGASCYHQMALAVGLSLTISFATGKLLVSPFHEIIALDFEPEAGRREFVISVLAEAPPPQQGG